MHKSRFVEKRKHAIEVFEIILQEGECFVFGWQRLVYLSREHVSEYVGLPMYPFVVIDGCCGNHVLE
jgi:hypothetical protein